MQYCSCNAEECDGKKQLRIVVSCFRRQGKPPPLPPPQKNAQVGSRSAATGNCQYVHRNGHILHAEKFAEIRWENPSNFTWIDCKRKSYTVWGASICTYFLQRSRWYVQFILVSASLQPSTVRIRIQNEVYYDQLTKIICGKSLQGWKSQRRKN